jgi:translation initiation factor IF-2
MRQRGAQMTDLVVLIVSATEGVKRQTQEIIATIKEKNIPTIVAINKLDLPNADPESVEKNLHESGLDI